MTAKCPRFFEAEAVRDGRLGEPERSNFERHTKFCTACAREVLELEMLVEKLRTTAPAQGDELRSRRERTRLLAAFDRELRGPDAIGNPTRRRLLSAAAAMVPVAAIALIWCVRLWVERPARIEASLAVVHADPGTAWSDGVDGDREVVTLDHGALSIRVDHATSARRLVVILPDGELEDMGTTFTVSADKGRTARVAVQEGSVVLHLRGQSPVTVGASDIWTPAAPSATVSACPSSTPSSAPFSTAPSHLPPLMPSAQAQRVPSSSGVALDASVDFSGPMAALDRGDNRAAAEGFARFLRIHASDVRAADAAYLRVIALQRCGDHDGMRAAGLEYIRRYPTGFRRAEVERLSR